MPPYKKGMTLVQALDAAMRAEGITTMTDLGARLGVTQGTASKWINQTDVPSLERAAALAKFIGTDEDTAVVLIAQARRQKKERADELTRLREEVAFLRRRVAELERDA